jgi:PEP-CTERM motif
MRASYQFRVLIPGLAGLILMLGAGLADAAPIVLDDFSTTTQPQPYFQFTVSIPPPPAGANAYAVKEVLPSGSGALGDTRYLSGALAGVVGSGGSLNAQAQATTDVATHTFQFAQTFSATAPNAFAGQYLLGYSTDPSFSVGASASANPSPLAATASAFSTVPNTFLASFLGQPGIVLNIASADAAAVGTVFNVGIADVSGNVEELSLTLTKPGSQQLFFPFAAFGPGTANGPFHGAGLSGPVDLANVGAVDVQFTPTPGGSFSLSSVEAATPSPIPVPEPSSLALLALGGVALAGWRRWKKHSVA